VTHVELDLWKTSEVPLVDTGERLLGGGDRREGRCMPFDPSDAAG